MARLVFAAALLALAAAPVGARAEAHLTYLHQFDGTDGCFPRAGVSFDSAGNLYGTAFGCGLLDKGVIYKLAPDGTFNVLSDFPKDGDGRRPEAELLVSPSGNIWGVSLAGGTADKGTVFELNPNGHLKTLHAFTGGSDGGSPIGVLVRDAAHNLYGATSHGGDPDFGVVFKVTADGSYSVLHTFTELSQGVDPISGLVADAQGNLYGTADGGSHSDGMVYKLTPDGSYSVLYSFGTDSSDGQFPFGTPVLDSQGNLYGTTGGGGQHGAGTIYKIAPDGTKTTLYSFGGTALDDGSTPNGVILVGNKLYGTTEDIGRDDLGTIFRYNLANGRYGKIYTFKKGQGYLPLGLLAKGPDGAIYGTTSTDGDKPYAGTIFKLED
jgi:uncharacterized repeat protein (TIGR03803 family)